MGPERLASHLGTEAELSLEKLPTLPRDREPLLRSSGISVGGRGEVLTILVPGCKFVVKAQVLAGGRGKGHWEHGMQGGVKLAKTFVPHCPSHALVPRRCTPLLRR